MEHAFSILMFVFAGALLLYAGIMAITKDYRKIPLHARVSVDPEDPKKYTRNLAKIVALCGTAIAIGAAVALWNELVGGIAMLVLLIAAIWFGNKKFMQEKTEAE